ncbi:hypothetical protein FA10DRAFT_298777 [Acaromyces ingoldii]|uniref:Uncharacterized protein n=1 Tax=Acaromyces ingoldii TaxID=215250 RepID=A0A316YVD7_9BASI|nr:hypothetical protein FA10DRAFT_298777 [Acaromyces ingoldii]PWN93377.1 hypothetical protein FA10DRAFT_298777 [Acaromyces ingoldii]
MIQRCSCSGAGSCIAPSLTTRGPLLQRIWHALPPRQLPRTQQRRDTVGGGVYRHYSSGQYFFPQRPDFLPSVKKAPAKASTTEPIDAGSALDITTVSTEAQTPPSERKVRQRYLTTDRVQLPPLADVDEAFVAAHQALVHGDVEAAWRAFESTPATGVDLHPSLFDAVFWSLLGHDVGKGQLDQHRELARRGSVLFSRAKEKNIVPTKLQRHRFVYVHATLCEQLLRRGTGNTRVMEDSAEGGRGKFVEERENVIARDKTIVFELADTLEGALLSRVMGMLSIDGRLEEALEVMQRWSATRKKQGSRSVEREERWMGRSTAPIWTHDEEADEVDQYAWSAMLGAAVKRLKQQRRAMAQKSTPQAEEKVAKTTSMAMTAVQAGGVAMANMTSDSDPATVQDFLDLLDADQLTNMLPDSLRAGPAQLRQHSSPSSDLAPSEAKAVKIDLSSERREEMVHLVASALAKRNHLGAAQAMLRRKLQGKTPLVFADGQSDVFAGSIDSLCLMAQESMSHQQYPLAMKHVVSALRFFFHTDWHQAAGAHKVVSLLPRVLQELHAQSPELLPEERWTVLIRQVSTNILTIDPTLAAFAPPPKLVASTRGRKSSHQNSAITLVRLHLELKDYAFAKRFFLIADELQATSEPFLTFKQLLYLFENSLEEEQADSGFTMLLHAYIITDPHWSTFAIPNELINRFVYRLVTHGKRPEFARLLRDTLLSRSNASSYKTGRIMPTDASRFVETFARACSAGGGVLLVDELLDFVEEVHDLLAIDEQHTATVTLFSRAMQLATQSALGWGPSRRAKVLSLFDRLRWALQEQSSKARQGQKMTQRKQEALRFAFHAACKATINAPTKELLYDLEDDVVLDDAGDGEEASPMSKVVEAILSEMETKWSVGINAESYGLTILSHLLDDGRGVVTLEGDSYLDRALQLAAQAIRRASRNTGPRAASDPSDADVGSKSWARKNVLSVHTVARLILHLARAGRYEDSHYILNLYTTKTPFLKRERLIRLAGIATLAREGKLSQMKQEIEWMERSAGQTGNGVIDDRWKMMFFRWAKEGEEERKFVRQQQAEGKDEREDEGQEDEEQEEDKERARAFAALARGQAWKRKEPAETRPPAHQK